MSALAWAGVAWGAGRSLPMLAILIGWFVGGAVSFGSRDRGGWVYGLMALGLTALAILAGEGSAGLLVGGGAAAGGIDVGGLASLGASRLAALLGDERVTPMLSVVSIPIGLFLAFVESSKGGLGASARLEEWRGPLPPLPDTVSSSG